ncbi:MAG: bifunctional 5,10-methylene-tetrahydrofolate dehydrogenase/5,10-methylene-tetrahydrofolate cyclohydrolase [Bacteroidetes bacterium]|jgi:methylenetetrahydrofolate dehydrogenase (NADP+) / methenyltetrahydrofolate cyclohydrolase|nr:bifunctional 5,10-methylene-tetrahydrofolate dehydrogenase/5,10-methylene-tetrahydrofolate cyclohydrolase [Bacteroidota bacterium]MBT4398033.1 bifunctional 5,10-methylene-tetrahydrofolate dehydrogenase/5,10-methylene-tetrahydrofolate cyclohydrolase [Bacteroidota bacterium]MBT4411291.1 bifunctional 5,10-methylene-tetrahydrofolate dehydrogenase/5,10-methylene-tetrahydrofolate cyclohydrolase [Bacteroidota bacterium]MBT5425032.1 bifunctional 5,10-methylene-tetrahydrofolate dehydrogenase/5,10-meth
MILIDGKKVAADIRQEIKEEITSRLENGGKIPHLAAILVGEDGASHTYVNLKMKACQEVGMKSSLILKAADISENDLLAEVQKLNDNPDVDGFIVQVPLPDHISEQKLIEAIDPKKDVDGFHPVNMGRMVQGLPSFSPATPSGIIELIERYKIPTSGKHCVVIGRSNIVGTPLALMLSRKSYPGDCTVTLCHSRTKNLKEMTLQADILIPALGNPGFLKADMVKEGAVIIDVGTTRVSSSETKSGFRLKGDVDFENVAPKCSYITPVPGGVGPMTIATLIKNTLKASK